MRPFIVAEISSNHLASIDRAMAIIQAAADAKANAIKLQCFTPEQMADAGTIIQSGPWAGRDALELYRAAHTPRAWFKPLFEFARWLQIEPFASVFHPDDVDFLETLDCPRYKIASFELTDLPLIRYATNTGKPMVVSTGMATTEDIEAAWWACSHEKKDLTLLHCVSAYPALPSDANLKRMESMRDRWRNTKIGLSDHTLGIGVAVAATALGATMIEKHLTLSRSDGGLDSAFSMHPEEFKAMVEACHQAADAIGEVHYGPLESEQASLQLRRKPGGKRAA